MPNPLLLASTSPRRREILTLMGLPFKIAQVDFSEFASCDVPWLSPGELSRSNAIGKARSVQAHHPKAIILAADTVVALGSRIFEKPVDLRQAHAFLADLSGKTHQVTTALALAFPQGGLISTTVGTQVRFKQLSAKMIEKYLKQVPVLDKAGGYSVQQHSDWIIHSITGSITNVIGLPVEALAELFLRLK